MQTISFITVSLLAISGLAAADGKPSSTHEHTTHEPTTHAPSKTHCHPVPTITKAPPKSNCGSGPLCIVCPTPTTIHVPCHCPTKPVTEWGCQTTGCANCPPPVKLDHRIPGIMCAIDGDGNGKDE